uniref:Putative transporter major facilitator superfamily n=1 Tax=Nyssomyia neivai TaxID=330878 RepID=A0A1L8DEN6_9DIPT
MKKNDRSFLGTIFPSPQENRNEQTAHSTQRNVENWCERNQKNKPQSNSVGAGIMMMLVSGLHIGWSIGSPNLRLQVWFVNVPDGEVLLALCSWFGGAIIGSFIALFILPMWEKKTIYYVGVLLCVISNAPLIGFPNESIVIILCRILAGISHGFIYITTIIHASENAVKEVRGLILGSIHFCIITSVFTTSILMAAGQETQGQEEFEPNMYIGIIGTVYSVMALPMIPFLTYESVVFLIERQRYSEAIRNMIKLRNESIETWEIKNDFDEAKLMVCEDIRSSKSIFGDGNLRPLLLMILVKFLFVLSFNYGLNMIKFLSVDDIFMGHWSSAFLFGIRACAALVALFFFDTFGRRIILAVSGGGKAISLLVYGFLNLGVQGSYVAVIASEIFVGLGLGSVADILFSEAFSTRKKVLSMIVVNVIENALQIALILSLVNISTRAYEDAFVFTTGGLMIVITIFLYLQLPETRYMSLRQTRDEFRLVGNATYSRQQPPQGITSA